MMCGGGWGGYGGYGGNALANDAAVIYPWMNQSNQVNNGFRDQVLNSGVNGVRDAVVTVKLSTIGRIYIPFRLLTSHECHAEEQRTKYQ
jgi:hypothetical protein